MLYDVNNDSFVEIVYLLFNVKICICMWYVS